MKEGNHVNKGNRTNRRGTLLARVLRVRRRQRPRRFRYKQHGRAVRGGRQPDADIGRSAADVDQLRPRRRHRSARVSRLEAAPRDLCSCVPDHQSGRGGDARSRNAVPSAADTARTGVRRRRGRRCFGSPLVGAGCAGRQPVLLLDGHDRPGTRQLAVLPRPAPGQPRAELHGDVGDGRVRHLRDRGHSRSPRVRRRPAHVSPGRPLRDRLGSAAHRERIPCRAEPRRCTSGP